MRRPLRMYLVSLADRHCKSVWELTRDYPEDDIFDFMALDKLRNDVSYRNKIELSLCETPEEKSAYLARKVNEHSARANRSKR